MSARLRTDRLDLESVTDDHLPLLVELNSDPQVMAFILGRSATPEETYAEWRRRLDHQSDAARGLGYWAGFEDGQFVGWWSASAFEGRPELSGVGYRLRQALPASHDLPPRLQHLMRELVLLDCVAPSLVPSIEDMVAVPEPAAAA